MINTYHQRMGRPVEWKPAWQSKPYRPSPARREHIYGPVRPMDYEAQRQWWPWLIAAVLLLTLIAGEF